MNHPSFLASIQEKITHQVCLLTVGRLYLTGSSMNGLGCRSSDADLCLVLRGNVGNAASHAQISFKSTHAHHEFFKPLIFCSRKDTIRFTYSLSSKDCSNRCVSIYNSLLEISKNKPQFTTKQNLSCIVCSSETSLDGAIYLQKGFSELKKRK